MAKYLYNGVVLPVLPEWDMETHPYAIIGYCDAQGYVFSYAAEPWTANEDGQIWPSRFLTYRLSDDTWVSTNGVVSYVTPVWTNTDIFNEDGTIYLTASDPVPVSIPKWVHMNSFLKGLALGLAAKPLEFAKEPVAYLYNGVRLPKLPEWDKEAYPYAFISNEVLNSVVFHALAKCPYNNGSPTSKGTICNPYDEAIPLVQCFLSADGNSWGDLATGSLGTEGQISEPFWANFDVLYQDGTLSLAASEPTPVYE